MTRSRCRAREVLAELIAKINGGTYDDPQVEDLLQALAKRLAVTNGKNNTAICARTSRRSSTASLTNSARMNASQLCYDLWYESKETALNVYTESRPERLLLSQNKEFKSVKNMV